MTHSEHDSLTPRQRELLGEAQADELLRNERWLDENLPPVELSADQRHRLSERVAHELHVQKRRSRPIRRGWPIGWAAAAALLLGGLLVIYHSVISPEPTVPVSPPTVKAVPPERPAVASAERDVDALVGEYVDGVDMDEDLAAVTGEVSMLSEELADSGARPWDVLVEDY